MTKTSSFNFSEGEVLLINKPLRWTSFDVVKKITRLTGGAKTGHAGTLDPLATGLLILCTGKFTKKISEYQGLEKEYTGTFILGATTDSCDNETPVNRRFPTEHITPEMIHNAAAHYTGPHEQTAPLHSAKKIKGKRAYEYARKGETAELKPSRITIYTFEITAINFPEVAFRVVCGKGTYIRSLVRDVGQHLGSGAYLDTLCRTRIGHYRLQDAWLPEELEQKLNFSKLRL